MSSVTSTTSTYWKTPTTTTSSDTTTTSSSNDSLNFQSFIQLLATELQYQDPQNPVDSTQYVAQMAQFASLNKLQSIGASIDSSQAYNLIGKTVHYETTDSSGTTTSGSGVVDSVSIKNSTAYVNIGSKKVALSSIVGVSNTTASSSNA